MSVFYDGVGVVGWDVLETLCAAVRFNFNTCRSERGLRVSILKEQDESTDWLWAPLSLLWRSEAREDRRAVERILMTSYPV